jgi:hypothetical protein
VRVAVAIGFALAMAACPQAHFSRTPVLSLLAHDGALTSLNRIDEAAARARGAHDWNCPVEQVTATDHGGHDGSAFIVEGCGHHDAYVAVVRIGTTSLLEGYEGYDVTAILTQLVPVSRGDAPDALADIKAQEARLQLGADPGYAYPENPESRAIHHADLDEWLALQAAATRDLSCTRDGLKLDLVRNFRAPSTYLAEGCGFRATFVKNGDGNLVIASRVALDAPPPQ